MIILPIGSSRIPNRPITVHCEWNDWEIGTCSKPCGGGSRTNTRTQKVSAAHGGNECNGTTSVDESCNVQECPGKEVFFCPRPIIKEIHFSVEFI